MITPGNADPTELVPPDGVPPYAPFSTQQNLRAGHAGFTSRFIAFVFDCAVSTGVFLLVLGAASFAANVLTGGSIIWHRGSLWVVLAFWGWEFFYYAYFWTTSGKTPGMTLLGVRVVGHDGSDVGTGAGWSERWRPCLPITSANAGASPGCGMIGNRARPYRHQIVIHT